MATLNYTVQQGETIFDIAAKLYKDFPFGLNDLFNLNNITISSPLPSVLVYTPGAIRTIPRYNIPFVNNPNQSFIVRDGQSWFDLAIQLFGSLGGIGNLTSILPSLDQNPVSGQTIYYNEDLLSDNSFFLKRIVCSIGGNGSGSDRFLALESGGLLETETGYFIKLE